MGMAGRVLFYPARWLRGEVTEPRTTLLFVSNSLLWGFGIAAIYMLIVRYQTHHVD